MKKLDWGKPEDQSAMGWQNLMAHYRKHLAAAVALNSGIFVVEAAAGYLAGSLSLIIDSIHNFS